MSSACNLGQSTGLLKVRGLFKQHLFALAKLAYGTYLVILVITTFASCNNEKGIGGVFIPVIIVP